MGSNVDSVQSCLPIHSGFMLPTSECSNCSFAGMQFYHQSVSFNTQLNLPATKLPGMTSDKDKGTWKVTGRVAAMTKIVEVHDLFLQ